MRICFEVSREERERFVSGVFRVLFKKETSFRFKGKKRLFSSLLIISLVVVVVVVVDDAFYSRETYSRKRDADEIAEEEGRSERFFVGFDRE